jgi:hypothetical protein
MRLQPNEFARQALEDEPLVSSERKKFGAGAALARVALQR